ncbi:MAG: transcription termination factor Rho [Planctomycetaceae bacterium]
MATQRPRSSSTPKARTPRPKKDAATAHASRIEDYVFEEAGGDSSDDDGFGGGIDVPEKKPKAAPRKRRTTKKTVSEAVPQESSAPAESYSRDSDSESRPRRSERKSESSDRETSARDTSDRESSAERENDALAERPRRSRSESNDRDIDFERDDRDDDRERGPRQGDDAEHSAAVGSSDRPTRSSSEGGDQGEDRGPRRSRRRRRRGKGDGASQSQGGGQSRDFQSRDNQSRDSQPSGGQSIRNNQRGESSGNSGGRGRFQKGRGNDRNDRNQRGGRNNDRNQRGGAPRHQKAAVGESHEPPVLSGTFEGLLELHPKQYGFLRTAANDYGALDTDPFLSSSLVEKYKLREGLKIVGQVGPGTRGQGPRILDILEIDGRTPEEFAEIKHFDTLTAINPHEQIRLETGPQPITMRVMDLLCPIGKGQRGLIVAPPRSGKTMLLQDIANAVSTNHPEIHLIVLLIDERPEEVTEMRRMVNGEVVASSMDRDVESHIRISQLVMERGKRIAESGKDCFILMDSVTRCARAFNKWVGGGRDSRTGTGGLDIRALEIPRKMFGTARLFDEGGSLTVCATALIDTGSRMDDAIFQEFKGTGNMEMVLSRDLADRRIWPAIDISKSGTRREEKILDPNVMEGVIMLRRALVSMSAVDAMTELTKKLVAFPSNKEFLERVRQVL